METSINANELLDILKITPSNQNIMITGKHGIGKSQILTNYFEKKNMKVIPLFLGQMSDPGDLIGLPHFNEKTGLTEFMPPYWFPIDGKPVVLFLDELNRARPEILQTIMDLALNRSLAGKKLPEGSRVISAVNAGDEYQLTDLDPALVSRFNVYTFKPAVDDWIKWANDKEIDTRIIQYIRKNPERLDGINISGEDSFSKTPDRRAWEKVSRIISSTQKLSPLFIKIISGIIGVDTATDFVTSEIVHNKNKITGTEVLLKGETVFPSFVNFTLPDFAELSKSIFMELENYGIKYNRRTGDAQKNVIAENFTAYLEWLSIAKKMEAFAYLTVFYTDETFLNANLFIKTSCPKACELLISFVSRIA